MLNAKNDSCDVRIEPFYVHFGTISVTLKLRRYVELEQPLDCAGSFKSEGLGKSV